MREYVLALPEHAETPALARRLVEHATAGRALAGAAVLVSARAAAQVSPAFAEELVALVLRDGGAAELVLSHARPDVAGPVAAAAARAGVAQRLVFHPDR